MTNPLSGKNITSQHITLGTLVTLLVFVVGAIVEGDDYIRSRAQQEIAASPVIEKKITAAVDQRAAVFGSEAAAIRVQIAELKTLVEGVRAGMGEIQVAVARLEGPQRGR